MNNSDQDGLSESKLLMQKDTGRDELLCDPKHQAHSLVTVIEHQASLHPSGRRSAP